MEKVDFAVPDAPPTFCMKPWFGDVVHKYCYRVVNDAMTWEDANNYCGFLVEMLFCL